MLISAPRAASAATPWRRRRCRCAPPRLGARRSVPGAGEFVLQLSDVSWKRAFSEAEHLLAPLAQILPGTVASVSI